MCHITAREAAELAVTRGLVALLCLFVLAPARAGAETLYCPTVAQGLQPPEDASSVPVITVVRLDCLRESVQLTNTSDDAIDLAGWTLKSARDGRGTQTFVMPAYRLVSGRSVYVHSGPFQFTPHPNRFRWTTRYMWNDDGDRAEIYTPRGVMIDWEACWQS